jgi:hypothetical protein
LGAVPGQALADFLASALKPQSPKPGPKNFDPPLRKRKISIIILGHLRASGSQRRNLTREIWREASD